MRAKFRVNSVESFHGGSIGAKLSAVTDDGTEENARYHKYTPSGQLQISIDNPNLTDFFAPGKEYYLDFTEAE